MSTVKRRVIQAGGLAVVALACVAAVLYPFATWYAVLVAIVPGTSFVLAGLMALSLRPRNRVGLLMTGVGVGLLTGQLSFQSEVGQASSALELVLHFVSPAWAVVLLHLLLAFPGGRLVSRLDRGVVLSFYAVVPLAGLLAVTVVGYPLLGPISPPVFDVQVPLAGFIYLACLVIGSGLVIRRWIQGGRARRRSMSPLILPMVLVTFFYILSTAAVLGASFTHTPLAGPQQFLDALAVVFPMFLLALPIGFLSGLLRSGLDMTSVGDLVVKLSSGLGPERLQPALAVALHDPSLEVAYWLPAQGWFADPEGRRIELPTADSERAVSVLGELASPVAALVYDSSLVHERQLVDTAAAAVRMALENARLQVQLRAQLEEVRQSRARLVEAADTERQRVERDLHDGAQQQLVTLLLSMQLTKAEAMRRGDLETAHLVDANIAALKQALDELRELAHGIHPTILTQAGLVPAIRSLGERCPMPVEITGDLGDSRLPQPLEAALYFVVVEAITNAVKHSKAQRMCVSVSRSPGLATVDVSDDGVGDADLSMGSGLRGLTDRVAAVGGHLVVRSNRGSGTIIHAEVPCE